MEGGGGKVEGLIRKTFTNNTMQCNNIIQCEYTYICMYRKCIQYCIHCM